MPGPTRKIRIPPTLLFAALYFSEGAPIGYIWWAMPTRLRDAGMPVDEVAAITAALTLSWALKFLWAPLVDTLRGPRWTLRAWITTAQIVMGLTLIPLGVIPIEELGTLAFVFLACHTFSAATQDVAIDALAIQTVPAERRGRLNGWMQAGMLLGRAIFGGVALAAEEVIGAPAVVGALIACIWASMALLWLGAPREPETERVAGHIHQFLRSLKAVLVARSTWAGVLLAVTAGAAFEAFGGLLGPYLLDRGVPKDDIGWFLALPMVGSMMLGALVGGWLADRVGHRWLVAGSVGAIAAWLGVVVQLDGSGVSDRALMAAIAPIYVLIGVLTASSYALFMDLTDPELAATQFSAFTGATNLCEVWAVASAGAIAEARGYAPAFMVMAAISLIAIPAAFIATRRRGKPAPPPPGA